MRKIFIFLILQAMLLPLAAAEITVPGTITGKDVNLRICPDVRYTEIARLTAGNEVAISAKSGEWYRVALPANAAVWVRGDLIKNGKMTGSVNLRSGPDSGYESYGALKSGTPVQPVKGSDLNGWVRIEPPPQFYAYVHRRFVKADAAQLKKLPTMVFDPKKTPSADKALIELNALLIRPGKATRADGYIYPLEEKVAAATHAIYTVKGDDLIPAAYLYDPQKRLKKFADAEQFVTVSGTVFRLQSGKKTWQLPVIFVTRIVPKKTEE